MFMKIGVDVTSPPTYWLRVFSSTNLPTVRTLMMKSAQPPLNMRFMFCVVKDYFLLNFVMCSGFITGLTLVIVSGWL